MLASTPRTCEHTARRITSMFGVILARWQVAAEGSLDATTTCDTCATYTRAPPLPRQFWTQVTGPEGVQISSKTQNPLRASRREVRPKPVRRGLGRMRAALRFLCHPNNVKLQHCRVREPCPFRIQTGRLTVRPLRWRAGTHRSSRRAMQSRRPCSMMRLCLLVQRIRERCPFRVLTGRLTVQPPR